MSEFRRYIDDIITNWKYGCGQEKVSDRGTSYIVVPIANRRGNFLNLIQTLVDKGFTKEEIRSSEISTKVVKECWSDLIVNMSAKDLRKNRDITRRQWEEAIKEFFAEPISEYRGPVKPTVPEFKKEAKKEKVLELDPTDRIKMDTSDVVDADLDLDFLEEIGLDESDVDGK